MQCPTTTPTTTPATTAAHVHFTTTVHDPVPRPARCPRVQVFGTGTLAALSSRAAYTVGPAGYCSPRHRVLFNSRGEGSKCVG